MDNREKAKIIIEYLEDYIQIDDAFIEYYIKGIVKGLKEIQVKEITEDPSLQGVIQCVTQGIMTISLHIIGYAELSPQDKTVEFGRMPKKRGFWGYNLR